MKKYLVLSKILKLFLIIYFIFVEIGSLQSGLDYRCQYLLLLYFIIPTLFLWGLIDWYFFSKIGIENNYVKMIPFGIAIMLYITLSFEGRYPINSVSLVLISVLVFSAILIFISLFGLRKRRL